MPKIADAWGSYLRAVVPADAPEVQKTECRRAFYAGCVAIFGLVTADLPEDEEDAELHLQELGEELRVYGREVSRLADITCCANHPQLPSVWCQRSMGHTGRHRNHEREWA